MMERVTRRLFLRNTAAAGAVGAAVAAPAVAEAKLTPDERIDAAVEEIKAAFREKWPDCPIRIDDCDNIHDGMLIILSHVADDAPSEVRHRKFGLARNCTV